MSRIDAAPGPTWLTYLVLFGICLVLAQTEGWISGGPHQFPTIDPVQAGFAIFFITPLVVLHYIDGAAGDAWDRFRPATDLDETTAARYRYELTVTPPRPAIVLTILGYVINVAWYAADPQGTGVAGRTVPYIATRALVEGFISAVLLVLVLQVIRQLRIVSRLHAAVTRVDLYQPASLHALSRLTSRSALAIIFLAICIDLPYPGTESLWVATTITFALPMLVLALLVFFVPLRGLHARLVQEKNAMSGAVSSRLREATAAIHRLVDDETANDDDVERSRAAQVRLDALSKAQASLIEQQVLIGKLSTWPWDTSTLRGVVSAVALPICLFVLTTYLGHYI